MNKSLMRPKCTNALLPMFQDCVHYLAMIKHSMAVVRDVVQFINQGQTPVIAFDQPLFALAKEIQWTMPQDFGEDRMVVMFGGLHIEMAAMKAAGRLLGGSGWTDALVLAEIATSGKANAYLRAAHVKRTRYAHQVTLASLHHLQQHTYRKYLQHVQTTDNAIPVKLHTWCLHRSTESPQFLYWSLVMELEKIIMTLVRSFREANFGLYMAALNELLPWLFALDSTHYLRWLPIHVKDMLQLEHKHPQIKAEFDQGKFTYIAIAVG